MAETRPDIILLVEYESPRDLGKAYLDSLRHHALLFSGPLHLEVMQRVRVRFTFPNGPTLTLFARVARRYGGSRYALRLFPGAGTETLLSAAREAAWDLLDQEDCEETTDFFERRVDLHDPENEDTLVELDLDTPELTPMDEVLQEGSGRFIEWLEREDDRQGYARQVIELEDSAELSTTAVIAPRMGGDSAEVDRNYLLRSMPTRQKKQLAVGAGREVREALMRDPDRTVQLWVLRNPALTEEEVARYAGEIPLAAEAVDFLVRSPKWSLSPKVARNLALNPCTPPDRLNVLLTVLPSNMLRELVQQVTASRRVRAAAAQLLTERTG